MPAGLSRSRINSIGTRLRKHDAPHSDDLDALDLYRDAHLHPFLNVLRRMHQLTFNVPLHYSARQKNVQTIIEKLKRERTALSKMQDIAGVRIVLNGGRHHQNEVVDCILSEFGQDSCTTKDRRIEPSYGYRAVHVILHQDGVAVEVQVRTHFQDLWAQLFERLGDQWGRQIRYGEPPDNSTEVILVKGVGVTREEVIRYTQQLADQISDAEEMEQRAALIDVAIAQNLNSLGAGLADVRAGRDEIHDWASNLFLDVTGTMNALQEVVPSTREERLVYAPPPSTSSDPTRYFLLAYKRSAGVLRHMMPFSGSDLEVAIEQRTRLQKEYQGESDVEVVLLASSNEDELVRTHSRYFMETVALADAKKPSP